MSVGLQGTPVARLFQKGLLKFLEQINMFLSVVMLDNSDLGKLFFLFQQLLGFFGFLFFVGWWFGFFFCK